MQEAREMGISIISNAKFGLKVTKFSFIKNEKRSYGKL